MEPILQQRDPLLDTLFAAHLLCTICEQTPWTQAARWHRALVCAACARSEPHPEEEEDAATRPAV